MCCRTCMKGVCTTHVAAIDRPGRVPYPRHLQGKGRGVARTSTPDWKRSDKDMLEARDKHLSRSDSAAPRRRRRARRLPSGGTAAGRLSDQPGRTEGAEGGRRADRPRGPNGGEACRLRAAARIPHRAERSPDQRFGSPIERRTIGHRRSVLTKCLRNQAFYLRLIDPASIHA